MEDHDQEQTPPSGGDASPTARPAPAARDRLEWLIRTLDVELRGILQRGLLWTDRLVRDLARNGSSQEAWETHLDAVREEVEGGLSLVNDLVAVARLEPASGDRPWRRSIVVRDLIWAAVRSVEVELEKSGVVVEPATTPDDLRLVADPEWALQAVTGLLRAGVRSARSGERLALVARAGGGVSGAPSPGPPGVRITLTAARLELGPEPDVPALTGGRPWGSSAPVPSRVGLPLASAGRYARLLEAGLRIERRSGAGVEVVLDLPSGGEPERRPGWIP